MHHAVTRLGDKDDCDRLRSVIARPRSDQGQVLAIEFCEGISFDLMATKPPILAALAQPTRFTNDDTTVGTNAIKISTTRIESFLGQKATCDVHIDVECTLFAFCSCTMSREQSKV